MKISVLQDIVGFLEYFNTNSCKEVEISEFSHEVNSF